MSETKPIPVRLDEGLILRLDSAAERMGMNRSSLIRFIVKSFGDHFAKGGLKSLPHDWLATMQSLDGRTRIAAETPDDLPVKISKRTEVRYQPKKRKLKSNP